MVRKTNTSSSSGPWVSLLSNFSIGCQAETKFVKTGRSLSSPMLSPDLLIGKRPIQGGMMSPAHEMPFSTHIIKKAHHPSAEHWRLHSKQDDGFTASCKRAGGTRYCTKEAHCTTSKRRVIANFELAESSLSRKHGLAVYVHERLNWTLCS